MPEKIITLYCFFDELLKALGHKDDPQAQLCTADIIAFLKGVDRIRICGTRRVHGAQVTPALPHGR